MFNSFTTNPLDELKRWFCWQWKSYVFDGVTMNARIAFNARRSGCWTEFIVSVGVLISTIILVHMNITSKMKYSGGRSSHMEPYILNLISMKVRNFEWRFIIFPISVTCVSLFETKRDIIFSFWNNFQFERNISQTNSITPVKCLLELTVNPNCCFHCSSMNSVSRSVFY